jgi:hypothetical protein
MSYCSFLTWCANFDPIECHCNNVQDICYLRSLKIFRDLEFRVSIGSLLHNFMDDGRKQSEYNLVFELISRIFAD